MADLFWIRSTKHDVYYNQALEEYLLEHCKKEQYILYLWQNQNTIVIGRNQNCYKECRVNNFLKDGGQIARRITGGGAVYHDLGNLNYSFISNSDTCELDQFASVIVTALNQMGLYPEITGRNDMIIEGKKFSGTAYYQKQDRYLYHGTVMLNVDLDKMLQYLSPPTQKFISKGVDSIRARVINLTQVMPEINTQNLENNMIQAFETIFNASSVELEVKETIGHERFASKEWIFNRKSGFYQEFHKKFEWGDLNIKLQVENGIITEAVLETDAMNSQMFLEMNQLFKNCPYESTEISRRITTNITNKNDEIINQIVQWINILNL
ncbi:MAG: lipoate--protein ligase [Lachnotalea sp.]